MELLGKQMHYLDSPILQPPPSGAERVTVGTGRHKTEVHANK